MNGVLSQWNNADEKSAEEAMLTCCGATRWATEMTRLRPIESIVALSEAADRIWKLMGEADWLEAFACHPRIGEREGVSAQTPSARWSRQEQSLVAAASNAVTDELAEGNARYAEKFGFTYIVCATGKSADDMLAMLKRRLTHDRATELREAAEQQRQILQIRLGKWLVE